MKISNQIYEKIVRGIPVILGLTIIFYGYGFKTGIELIALFYCIGSVAFNTYDILKFLGNKIRKEETEYESRVWLKVFNLFIVGILVTFYLPNFAFKIVLIYGIGILLVIYVSTLLLKFSKR